MGLLGPAWGMAQTAPPADAVATPIAAPPAAPVAAPATAPPAARAAAPRDGAVPVSVVPPLPAGQRRPRIGLVLSGGGARGFAHIGVLKVLEELKVPIDLITATSMGSIVGGAYATGYTPEQLQEIARTNDWNSIFSLRAPRAGLSWQQKEDDYKNLATFEFGIKDGGVTLPQGAVGTQNLGVFLRRLDTPAEGIDDLAKLPIPFAAMATNLATGRLVVLQKGVDLATAMRASMSVPGAFAPVDFRGQSLVDGGLVRNLPVDIARAMGADIIIAVNVGTPLLKRDQIRSLLSVGEQMINILTEQNVERSLGELRPGDILITPDLGTFTASDFVRNQAIVDTGEVAARAVADRLEKLSLPPVQYAAVLDARQHLSQDATTVVVRDIRIEGLGAVNPDAVRAQLELPLDTPVTTDQVGEATARVFATGDFETVSYRLEGTGIDRRLVVTPLEKTWGQNTLRVGGNAQTDFRDVNTYNLLLAHTWNWVNSAGGRWRNEVQIGDTQRLLSEFTQPLAAGSPWFVQPRLEGTREAFDVYLSDTPLARYRNTSATAQVSGGYAIGRLGYAMVGVGAIDLRTNLVIGPPLITNTSASATIAGAEVTLDTLDQVAFPRSGYFAHANYYRLLTDNDELAGRDALSLNARAAWSYERYIVNLRVAGGLSAQNGSFRLGGLFNLSGTPYGRYFGAKSAIGSLAVYRNISDAFGELQMPIYVGGSLEVGNAVARTASLSDPHKAGSLFVGVDSPIGPLFFGVGHTVNGATGVYLLWGVQQ